MCGICGQYNFESGAPVARHGLETMTATIRHRGPDDEGYYLSDSLGLGFRRLSIIDLEGGHQPMSDPEETVWVVFNGEIYNFRDLRRELEGYGHVFRTQSDTEVIVRGYKHWGIDVLDRLRGMFGLAIWDERDRRLFLARDAMGIKPLYYRVHNGELSFGSEIRPILAASNAQATVDPSAIYLFLRFRYTPAPYTAYAGIRKLPPGGLLIADTNGCRTSRWYAFEPRLAEKPPSDQEATEQLLELYKRAVGGHLISDVPLGLLLSGGVDSGLLLALMNLYGSDWPTYTVGYGRSYKGDELIDASETARLLGASNYGVELTREKFEKSLPSILAQLEEPIAASSIVPMYFVSQRARQDVKVVLIGQGPDELFGGYKRHLGVHYGRHWAALPSVVRRPVAAVINALHRNETLKRGARALGTPDRFQRYAEVFALAPHERIKSLFRPDALPLDIETLVFECWNGLRHQIDDTDELGGFQLLELRSSLPDELLMYADKMSMAHSLEVRVPFLDRDVVEYTMCLPARFKVRGGTGKWLHRRVCERFLSSEILSRKKRGFAVNVVDKWFDGAVGSTIDSSLRDQQSMSYRFLNPDSVNQLYREHARGQEDHHKVLFSLVALEQWLRLKNSPPAGKPATA